MHEHRPADLGGGRERARRAAAPVGRPEGHRRSPAAAPAAPAAAAIATAATGAATRGDFAVPWHGPESGNLRRYECGAVSEMTPTIPRVRVCMQK